MIDLKTAKAVFQGLSGMVGIPMEKEAVRQRLQALQMKARSEGHGVRVVEHLRATLQYFPSEREIIDACEYLPDDVTITESARDCSYCHGELWISIDGPYGLTAAYRCNHNGPVPINVGVRLSSALQKHYAMEAEAARLRRDAWYRAQAETPDARYQANEQRQLETAR